MIPAAWIDHMHVELAGPEDGIPVVLLHGWGSNASLMRVLAQGIQEVYRVHNVDLPGHGATPPPPEPWGVPEYAELVGAYIQKNIGQPVHVVGHSNGGRISMFMASEDRFKECIKSLSLISPSGIRRKRSLKYYFKKAAATVLKAPFQPLPAPLKEYGLDWLRHSLFWRMLGSSDYRSLTGVMRGTFVKTVNFYVEDRLDRIDVPTLLFWGTNDEMISRQQMEHLEQHISGSALIELEGAGHYGHLDQPGNVVPPIRHFLEHLPVSSVPVDA